MTHIKKFVGDRVRVLDGADIPNYTGGWYAGDEYTPLMSEYVGQVATVIEVIDMLKTKDGEERRGCRLGGLQSAIEEHPEDWIFDERGLALISRSK